MQVHHQQQNQVVICSMKQNQDQNFYIGNIQQFIHSGESLCSGNVTPFSPVEEFEHCFTNKTWHFQKVLLLFCFTSKALSSSHLKQSFYIFTFHFQVSIQIDSHISYLKLYCALRVISSSLTSKLYPFHFISFKLLLF